MSTTISGLDYGRPGRAPASSLTRFVDRWIFVLMAAWFIRNVMLLQIQVGILFTMYIGIALYLRKSAPGVHKRLIFLAVAIPLPAAFDRIDWLPHTMPETPLASFLYILLAVAPMFIWDVLRTRTVHKAYSLWLAGFLPSSVLIYLLWNTDWWQATAPRLVGL